MRRWLAQTPVAGLRTRLLLIGARRREPVTLNEKIRFRMAADRRPVLTQFVDKLAVRELVRAKVGPDVLPKLFGVVDSVEELDITALPDRCVIKPSHGSGVVIVVDDRAPAEAALPLRSSTLTWQYLKVRVRREALFGSQFPQLARSWLRADYSRVGGGWCYRDVPPRLMVEELLDPGDGHSPADHRIWCVDGHPVLISRDIGWGEELRRVRLTPDWRPIVPEGAEVSRPERPVSLDRMLDVARALAEGIDFVRVDLYDLRGRVMFGELTTYPGGGRATFSPEDTYTELFASWRPDLVVKAARERKVLP
jgi:hypothetical protein